MFKNDNTSYLGSIIISDLSFQTNETDLMEQTNHEVNQIV